MDEATHVGTETPPKLRDGWKEVVCGKVLLIGGIRSISLPSPLENFSNGFLIYPYIGARSVLGMQCEDNQVGSRARASTAEGPRESPNKSKSYSSSEDQLTTPFPAQVSCFCFSKNTHITVSRSSTAFPPPPATSG